MRLWSTREVDDSGDEAIPAPVEITPIMEYTMEGADAEGLADRLVVTIPEQEDISSRRVSLLVKGLDGSWDRL